METLWSKIFIKLVAPLETFLVEWKLRDILPENNHLYFLETFLVEWKLGAENLRKPQIQALKPS